MVFLTLVKKIRSLTRLALLLAALALLVGGLLLARGTPTSVDELGWLALGLTIAGATALFAGHIAAQLGQPAVLGELLAGILLGNLPGLSGLRFIAVDSYLDILARLGMLLLLFEVGLELSVRDLFAVGRSSLLVALIGTVSSLVLGTLVSAVLLPQAAYASHFFLGAAITATSVGITARVLKDLGASRSLEAKTILGAAVVDDVLALVVLGAMTTWVIGGNQEPGSGASAVLALVMKTVGFLVLAIALGEQLTPAWFRHAAKFRTRGALLVVGLCLCFFLSWAASAIGIAALVGAFAAGLVLEDSHSQLFVQRGERPLNDLLEPIVTFLVPIFFVLVGFRTSLAALLSPLSIGLAIGLTAAAVLGKLACAAGVIGQDGRRWTIAAGMIPRGEVALVFAALGRDLMVGQAPLLDTRGYTAVVAVVILTTLMTPPLLKWTSASNRGTRITRPAA
jgi:Kef-type K+ transport system membrane component KefB